MRVIAKTNFQSNDVFNRYRAYQGRDPHHNARNSALICYAMREVAHGNKSCMKLVLLASESFGKEVLSGRDVVPQKDAKKFNDRASYQQNIFLRE